MEKAKPVKYWKENLSSTETDWHELEELGTYGILLSGIVSKMRKRGKRDILVSISYETWKIQR